MVVTKNAKGFTLVELMIVVAIIGVLAVTLLPVLNGAQERARDGGRVASLNNIATALVTYNSDAGQFPTSNAATATATETGTQGCLSNSSGATATDLGALLKGGRAPLDPQRASVSGACAAAGAYEYFPLQKGGITASSFLLVADVETAKKANYDRCNGTASVTTVTNGLGDTETYEVRTAANYALGTKTAEPNAGNKKCSTYAVVN